jgi:hypothetical protein
MHRPGAVHLCECEEAERRSVSVPVDVRAALAVQRALRPTKDFQVKLLLSAEIIYLLDAQQAQGYMSRHGHGGINARAIEGLMPGDICSTI